MVYELKSLDEYREYISKHRLAVVAIANKDKEELWRYVIEVFKDLECAAEPPIQFAVVHYQLVAEALKSFELDRAKRSILIKLFLNGDNVFEQEGVTGVKLNDEAILKRGIRESLKPYSISIRFTPT